MFCWICIGGGGERKASRPRAETERVRRGVKRGEIDSAVFEGIQAGGLAGVVSVLSEEQRVRAV